MLSSAYDRHTDSEQVTSLEDFDNMIKLLFGYGQKLTDCKIVRLTADFIVMYTPGFSDMIRRS